jgi:hypothetical protein
VTLADPSLIQGFLSGGVQTSPSAGQVFAIMCACAPAQIRSVVAASRSGVGTTDTILDVRNNGLSIWTNPTHRPTLAAGKTGRFAGQIPNHRAVQIGDVLTLVVVQAGGHADVAATAALEQP